MTPVPVDIVIHPERELMITDLGVVEDPVRTGPGGVWTFRHLIETMAGPHDPADFVMNWLQQWEVNQQINGFTVPARPLIRQLIIDPWLQSSSGQKLDLDLAPFRLLAIVNRIDLLQFDHTVPVVNAGEGRFVFGVLDSNGNPLQFTVIFEYEQLARGKRAILGWARAWHRLGKLKLGSVRYNHLLERITSRFTGPNSAPNKPNGNAINQIRTNEIALAGPWEMREFVLTPDTGRLEQTTVKETPDFNTLNGTSELASLINDNEAAILAGTFSVPADMLAGAAPTFAPWNASGIGNNDARHLMALNTCNGCHQAETGTVFLHVSNRQTGSPSILSGFLTGITTSDPISGVPRSFNDLDLRAAFLKRLVI
jgi:hypothetical protein